MWSIFCLMRLPLFFFDNVCAYLAICVASLYCLFSRKCFLPAIAVLNSLSNFVRHSHNVSTSTIFFRRQKRRCRCQAKGHWPYKPMIVHQNLSSGCDLLNVGWWQKTTTRWSEKDKDVSAAQNLNSFARRVSLFEKLITDYIACSDHSKLVKDVNELWMGFAQSLKSCSKDLWWETTSNQTAYQFKKVAKNQSLMTAAIKNSCKETNYKSKFPTCRAETPTALTFPIQTRRCKKTLF